MAAESREIVVRSRDRDVATIPGDRTRAIWAGVGSQAMNAEIVRALAIVGEHYQLDPALGQVLILGSKVYISKDGYLAIAQRNPNFEGLQTRPMTDAERKDAKAASDEHCWVCAVYRKGWRVPAVAWGSASERTIQMKTIVPYAREMAEGRAIRRALKLAFGLDLPDADQPIVVDGSTGEVITRETLPAVSDVAEPRVAEIGPDWRTFWAKTKALGLTQEQVHEALRVDSVKDFDGSLAEAIDLCVTWKWQQDEARRSATAGDESEPTSVEPEQAALFGVQAEASLEAPSPKREVPRLSTIHEFLADCHRRWRMQPSQVAKELGYDKLPSHFDFQAAWLQIAEVKGA